MCFRKWLFGASAAEEQPREQGEVDALNARTHAGMAGPPLSAIFVGVSYSSAARVRTSRGR
jgi:hypothetical protein